MDLAPTFGFGLVIVVVTGLVIVVVVGPRCVFLGRLVFFVHRASHSFSLVPLYFLFCLLLID